MLTVTDISTPCAVSSSKSKWVVSRQPMAWNSNYWLDRSIKSRFYRSSVSEAACYWLWRLLNVICAFQTVFMSQLNSRFLLVRSLVIQLLCRKCLHKKYFNSHKICLEHQHGRSFIVLPEHQYGRRDVMWKRSITGALRQIRIKLTCSSGEDWSETSL